MVNASIFSVDSLKTGKSDETPPSLTGKLGLKLSATNAVAVVFLRIARTVDASDDPALPSGSNVRRVSPPFWIRLRNPVAKGFDPSYAVVALRSKSP